jgi:hypothetical protein
MASIPAIAACGTFLALLPGCSTRNESPTLAADSTLVYAGKDASDLSAAITFSEVSKVSRRTGKRLGVTRTFDIAEGEKVYAFVDLQNVHARGDRPLEFHLVWLKPSGATTFKKRLVYFPSDSSSTLSGSLSIGKRSPGDYTLRVYLFRELIAEKSFHLRGEGFEQEEESGGEM